LSSCEWTSRPASAGGALLLSFLFSSSYHPSEDDRSTAVTATLLVAYQWRCVDFSGLCRDAESVLQFLISGDLQAKRAYRQSFLNVLKYALFFYTTELKYTTKIILVLPLTHIS
jgi:hypothetical protein